MAGAACGDHPSLAEQRDSRFQSRLSASGRDETSSVLRKARRLDVAARGSCATDIAASLNSATPYHPNLNNQQRNLLAAKMLCIVPILAFMLASLLDLASGMPLDDVAYGNATLAADLDTRDLIVGRYRTPTTPPRCVNEMIFCMT